MQRPSSTHDSITRRGFIGGATALAAGLALPRLAAAADAPKPNSDFGGVRIGTITYSYRGFANTADETLKALVAGGLSECELMGGPIQGFAGITGGKPTDAQREERLAKCRELRKIFNDAGVNIHLHKMGVGGSDEEIDFSFLVAKALGAVGLTTERDENLAKRVGPFADKHKIWLAFHNHTANYPVMDKPDPILECGEYVGFNFDVGHYVAGTKGKSPIPVIEKYHDRIVSLHLKDRNGDGGNLPWGQGTTPIKEILQLIRKEKWTFPSDVELEYSVPKDSDPVKEVAKCVQFCKEALA
ncbi:MAG: sugar phosphate isomerase/epimerase [Armatimonadetes bacterium]|nr:sugar phosphate isomerase/epimerase [Armatimonadota bacterium]